MPWDWSPWSTFRFLHTTRATLEVHHVFSEVVLLNFEGALDLSQKNDLKKNKTAAPDEKQNKASGIQR